jgi:hypothetical protein
MFSSKSFLVLKEVYQTLTSSWKWLFFFFLPQLVDPSGHELKLQEFGSKYNINKADPGCKTTPLQLELWKVLHYWKNTCVQWNVQIKTQQKAKFEGLMVSLPRDCCCVNFYLISFPLLVNSLPTSPQALRLYCMLGNSILYTKKKNFFFKVSILIILSEWKG